MNRKTVKPEWRGWERPDGVGYRSDPSLRAQNYWYYVLFMGTSKVSAGFKLQQRPMPHYLLHYVRRGEMWHSIGDRVHAVAAGQVCLMYLQDAVRYGVDRGGCEVWWILFGGRQLPHIVRELRADQDPVFPLPDRRRFEVLFRDLLALVKDRPAAYQATSFGQLALILAEMFASREATGEADIDLVRPAGRAEFLSEPVLNAIRRMGRFYHDPITLKWICEATNLSLHYFCRLFQREMGMSPMRYLTCYRIEKAKEILLSTPHPVERVARMVGMPDRFVFARTFRKITGQTPTRFRASRSRDRNDARASHLYQ